MSGPITCTELINIFNRIGGKISINYKNKKCSYDNRIYVDIKQNEYGILDDLLWEYQASHYKLATEIKKDLFEKIDKIHRYQDTNLRELTYTLDVDERGLKNC